MSQNSPLPAALVAEKAAFLGMKAAREEAANALDAASSHLELLRAAVNRARKEKSPDLDARCRVLRETEEYFLGKAMAKLAAASVAHAKAAEALATVTCKEAVSTTVVEAVAAK